MENQRGVRKISLTVRFCAAGLFGSPFLPEMVSFTLCMQAPCSKQCCCRRRRGFFSRGSPFAETCEWQREVEKSEIPVAKPSNSQSLPLASFLLTRLPPGECHCRPSLAILGTALLVQFCLLFSKDASFLTFWGANLLCVCFQGNFCCNFLPLTDSCRLFLFFPCEA